MQINIKYGLGIFFKSPRIFLNELKEDLIKDYIDHSIDRNFHFILCAALPKSGSTLIEKILNKLNYVQLNKSFLRNFSHQDIDHPHGISNEMLKSIPVRKFSFLKTHTHFSDKYLQIMKKYNSKIIISTRNIYDMLISNYFYIMSNPNSWEHNYLINLDPKVGLIKSLYLYDKKKVRQTPLEYYLQWIYNWEKIIKRDRILNLKFEDLILNQDDYINKILNYLNINSEISSKISKMIEEEKINSKNLKKNLNNVGRSISTYDHESKRKKEFIFDKEFKEEFTYIINEKARELDIDMKIIKNEF